MLTGRPDDTSVYILKATVDNENVDAVQRHAQDELGMTKDRLVGWLVG